MDKNGKNNKFLIEDHIQDGHFTGVKTVSTDRFVVWANKGVDKKICAIEGVSWVVTYKFQPTYFIVVVDPRYDFEFVKKEVEAVLMCAEDGGDE